MVDDVNSGARRARTLLRVALGVCAVIVLVLATDVVLTRAHTARGATIAGIDAGNRDQAAAQRVLDQLSDRAARPVSVRTSSGTAEFSAQQLGLRFDADATRERLLDQPRNPIDRILGLFGVDRPVEPVVTIDRAALGATLDGARKTLERAAVEGGVHYRGAVPVGDLPAAGLRVNRDAAATTLTAHWLDDSGPIDLPMEPFSPTVNADVVKATVAGPATRATAAPLTVTGRDGVRFDVAPAEIGSMVTFVPDGRGGLKPRVDPKRAREVLGAELSGTEREPVSATFTLSGGSPKVVPSRDGAKIDWKKTIAGVGSTIVADRGPRSVAVTYQVLRPKLTTAGAEKLGIREVVSEFTTGDFSSASGENIRLVAEEVDGAVVLPGETFSLNGYTGPRGAAQGYVTSTVIDEGRAEKAIGGGISQFATTLYNAEYFAGLEDVEHTEHSYYISRYPEAREATVYEGAIDLKFRNNTKYGIYIETGWTPSSVTVRMWSTKTVNVQSITGERSAYTSPETLNIPAGDNCLPSSGARGFTTSNTRVITDASTGAEISRNTRTVKYDPEPIVRCV
ncbi:VanW family protein [Gordonia sinesedis]